MFLCYNKLEVIQMKEMIVKLNTETDVKNFDKKIWLYRSIFYRNIHFVVETIPIYNEYINIVNALNIKNRFKRIKYIYDTACEQIDNHNKENNINCEFKCGKCLAHYDTRFYNGCCRVCRFQSKHGCTTKNLTCKLFFCSPIRNKYKTLTFSDVKLLKCLSKKNQIIVNGNFFASRNSFLFVLYTGSFVVLSLTQFFNILFMPFSYNKHKKAAMSLYESIDK